jgi:ATP-dependent Clp protease ATP-binding subunit ClpA
MPGHNLERFTRRARHVLTLAQTEAERMLHERITTEHLLLALLGEDAGVASRVLVDAGLSIDQTRRFILETTTSPTQEWGRPIELSDAVKRVLELAVEEARTLQHRTIGTEHLLLGLLRLDDPRIRDLFARFEVEAADLRDNTLHKIKETSTLSDEPPGTEMLKKPGIPHTSSRTDHLTPGTKQVLASAREAAEQLGSDSIGTEHLLLGLIQDEDGIAGAALRKLGLEQNRVQALIEELTQDIPRTSGGTLDFSSGSKHVLELAVDEARRMGHRYVGTEHVLLSLLRQNDGLAMDVLRRLEVSRTGIWYMVRQAAKAHAEKVETGLTLISTEEVTRVFARLRNGEISADEAETLLQRNMQPYTMDTLFRYIMRVQSGWPTEDRVIHIKLTDTRDNSPGGEIHITGRLAVMAFTRLLGNLSEGRTGVTWTGMSGHQSAEIRIDLDEGE